MDPINGNTASLDDRMNSTIGFMDELDKQREKESGMAAMRNTPEVKRRLIEREKEHGKEDCLKYILGKVYCDSIPDNVALPTKDLDKEVSDFVAKRTDGKDCLFYVKEAIKKENNPILKNIYESVNALVNQKYFESEMNLDKVNPDELGFVRTPELKESLDKVIKDNDLDGLAEVIKDNVKTSVSTEIEAAKKEKDSRMQLEDELANRADVTTPTDVNTALESANLFKGTTLYQPSLFEGIMINKFAGVNNAQIKPYAESSDEELITEGAFAAIKDYFKTKKEADAKASVVTSNANFTKWLDRIYRKAYGIYRSSIMTMNFKVLGDQFSKMISDKELFNPNASVVMIDLKTWAEQTDTNVKLNKVALENGGKPVPPADNYPGKRYTYGEALEQNRKSVSAVQKEFDDPKIKQFIEKYGKMAANAGNKCGTSAQVAKVYDIVSYLALSEINMIFAHVTYVRLFTTFAKDVIDYGSKRTLKESAFEEATREYTMFNVAKALTLESFDIESVKTIANNYASGKY